MTKTKIVPLYKPTGEIIQAAKAKLIYGNGPLISNVEIFTIFWGAFWDETSQATLANDLNAYFDVIVQSPLIEQLKEYSVPQYPIGFGKRIGTLIYTTSQPPTQITDQQLQDFLQKLISTKVVSNPTPNTLYFIYTPSKVTVEQGGSVSCTTFCGYHDAIQNNIFYAIMPYPDCVGCLGGLSIFDALTSISSHELCEAITDPIPGLGWYDQQNGEVGDICAWKTKKDAKYVVQQEWSNKQNKCI